MPEQGANAAAQRSNNGAISAAIIAIIAGTIALEGGWVNNPADPGGETNKGVTKAVAVKHGYTGPMRSIPDDVVTSIYYQSYLVKPGYAALVPIDAAVAEELFDTTVNMGQKRPSTWFQRSINVHCAGKVKVDGRVGPGTVAAYAACQNGVGAVALCRLTLDYLDLAQLTEYKRLVARNPKLKRFYKGWVAHRIRNVDRRKCGVT
jgi:lysozyme family protein